MVYNRESYKNNDNKYKSSYMQLYGHFKDEILSGRLPEGSKLPSLRDLARDMGLSVTTAQLAYDQLVVEGYIYSKPQSGYYVSAISPLTVQSEQDLFLSISRIENYPLPSSPYVTDSSTFDFTKWKKCCFKVLTDYSHLLFFESDPQGEEVLRFEISKYLSGSRGVSADPSRIVIGAGTQQITIYLCRILSLMGINHVSLELPGYLPVQRMFKEAGFNISHIPVSHDGIKTHLLPQNISSAAYVSPSNQFPTGSIMPIGKRYELIQWASANQSIVIEDDYDSELRYFGKPVPALQGLDKTGNVVYLGSFSSTLFPAIKIAYMVLPENMADIFSSMKELYAQTCSKEEQLALALFMKQGHYLTGIKKLRKLNAQKLSAVLSAIDKYGKGTIQPINSNSGINIILRVNLEMSDCDLCSRAKTIGLQIVPLSDISQADGGELLFYYNQLPLGDIDSLIAKLVDLWK